MPVDVVMERAGRMLVVRIASVRVTERRLAERQQETGNQPEMPQFSHWFQF
jgi:hypothetical protein